MSNSTTNTDVRDSIRDVEQEFVSKKAEKIAQAIYLLTNTFDHREALRWSMRSACLDLVTALAEISFKASGNIAERVQSVSRSQRIIKEVVTFLSLGESVRLISSMNVSYIVRELNLLETFIKEKYENPFKDSESLSLNESFFYVPKPEPMSFEKDMSYRTIKDRSPIESSPYAPMIVKGANVAEFQRNLRERLSGESASNSSHQKRREMILDIAKKMPMFSIKDISSTIPSLSEKTIQRELLVMVREGVLTKEGERRWSRYKLAIQ